MARTRIVRVVSLVPSVTETISSWGRGPFASTRFCERPDLQHVGGTKDPDVARIIELAPDLVVVDTEENRREDHDALVAAGLEVHALSIRSLADVNEQLPGLAARLDLGWSPEPLVAPMAPRARAFVPIWRRPWMALGTPTYGASLLAHLGIEVVFGDRGPYPQVDLEEATALRPDLVLAPSEPYPFTTRQLPELTSVAPTEFVDGKDLFWWGMRTPLAIARLRRQLGAL
jgi:ABC-type Fe3+-hydroxamate transport system substrate-binding protein